MSVSNESRQLSAQFFLFCAVQIKRIFDLLVDLSVYGESDGTILSKQGY